MAHFVSGHRTQELWKSRGGCPGPAISNKPDGFCGRKATLKHVAVGDLVNKTSMCGTTNVNCIMSQQSFFNLSF